jgi:hypothetical protein
LLHRKTLRPDDRKTGFRFEHCIVPVRQRVHRKSTIDPSRKLRVWGISNYPSLGGRGDAGNALNCQMDAGSGRNDDKMPYLLPHFCSILLMMENFVARVGAAESSSVMWFSLGCQARARTRPGMTPGRDEASEPRHGFMVQHDRDTL